MRFACHGLHCAHCGEKIRQALEETGYFETVTLDTVDFVLAVTPKPTTPLDDTALLALLQATCDRFEEGVEVSPLEASPPAPPRRLPPALLRPLVSLGVVLLCLLLQAGLETPSLVLALRLIAYLVLALPLGFVSLRRLKAGVFLDEHSLMLLASLGALALGEWGEAIAVIALYQIGELLQAAASHRARQSLAAVRALRPDRVRVLDATTQTTHFLPPESVAVGSRLLIYPGERIPLDGRLLSPTALCDARALTGESLPRLFKKGEEVAAGLIVLEQRVELEALRPASDSALARLIHLTEAGSRQKAPTERLVTRLARIYTPLVVGLALCLALGGPLLGLVDWATGLRHGLILLVLACPCALVLSVPLAYTCSLAKASQAGILLKGSQVLDALVATDSLLLDKTGTLTEGRLHLSQCQVLGACSEAEALRLAASLEQESSHPLAQALRRLAEERGLTLLPADTLTIQEIVGQGVQGSYQGARYHVGRPQALQIALPSGAEEATGTDTLGTRLLLWKAPDQPLALFTFEDPLRPEAKDSLHALRQLGLKHQVLLSGDQSALVAKLVDRLGLDAGYGDCLPADKQAYLTQATAQGRHVLFVGDGLNDTPCLAQAQVGLAMGQGGAEAALDAADGLLMHDSLSQVVEARRLAMRGHRVAVENIVLSLGVKALIVGLSFCFPLPLWLALFGDVGMALLAVGNSLRLLRGKDAH